MYLIKHTQHAPTCTRTPTQQQQQQQQQQQLRPNKHMLAASHFVVQPQLSRKAVAAAAAVASLEARRIQRREYTSWKMT